MKKAFTLAEVLITLGIIGVVAALTIPTLISNYQKKQWVSGLQRGYATLQNVVKMVMADNMVESLYDTNLHAALPDGYINADVDCSAFVSELSKYLKITKFCNPIAEGKNECFNIEYKLIDGFDDDGFFTKNNRLKIYTADGMVYYFSTKATIAMVDGQTEKWNDVEIDVNGDNPPNQHGRDLFSVVIFENGKIIFPGTGQWVQDVGGCHWSDSMGRACDINGNWSNNDDYCGARIFENGWRMDY